MDSRCVPLCLFPNQTTACLDGERLSFVVRGLADCLDETPRTHSWLSTPCTATPAPAPLRARSSTPSPPSSSPSRPTPPGSRTRARPRRKRPRRRATSMPRRAGRRTSIRTRFARRACLMRALGACGSCSRGCRRRCEVSSDPGSICTYYPSLELCADFAKY